MQSLLKRGSRILIQGEQLLHDKKDPVYIQADIRLPIMHVVWFTRKFMYKIEQLDDAHNILKTETGIAQDLGSRRRPRTLTFKKNGW